jgi:hypothetical protein
MEFTFKVSEAEYLRASKLRGGSLSSLVAKIVVGVFLFWVFILICLVLLWAVVVRSTPRPHGTGKPATTQQPAATRPNGGTVARTLLETGGPLIIFVAVFAFVLRRPPTALLDAYRNDSSMQGQFTVDITRQSISVRNTTGISSKSGWNAYAFWRERKSVMVLIAPTGAYFILSLAGLSEGQRAELRGILSAALPKK